MVCDYTVKSTWIKDIQVGNYLGWALITERNMANYYPETTEILKVHMNQTRKIVRLTKPKRTPLDVRNTSTLPKKKVQDVYTNIYEVRNTVFSDQSGQFPTRSQQGNKYIMVMVKIDSNAILVKPLKIRKDAELTRAYRVMMLRLRRA